MEHLGQLNGRQILYLSLRQTKNWSDELPTSDWLVIPIGYQKDLEIHAIAKECLTRNVLYVCALGSDPNLLEDAFDAVIVSNALHRADADLPMTTMHRDFEEGFWFATTVAFRPEAKIDKVVCLDLTEHGNRDKIARLVEQINTGWLPSDIQIARSHRFHRR